MTTKNKATVAVDELDLGKLVHELPPFSPLPLVCRFLGDALSVRQLLRRIEGGRLFAIRTSSRGSGRYLVPRSEVARLVGEMRANAR